MVIRNGYNGMVCVFLLQFAIEQERIIGPVRHGITVLPGHAVVQPPEGHAIDLVPLLVQDAEELAVADVRVSTIADEIGTIDRGTLRDEEVGASV